MNTRHSTLETLWYVIVSLVTILVLQAVIVVVHEFTHSTMAWLLGAMASPLDIVWGNPVMMTGWDEGVSYTTLYAKGRGVAAAIIGICPLIMHSTMVAVCIRLMHGPLSDNRWAFHVAYWLVVVNLMELVAYVYMRAFSGHGDIGNFNHGLDLSPWWVFVFGSAALTWVLWYLFRFILPMLQVRFARGNIASMWAILGLTSFVIFLWGSGIRVLAYVPGAQSLFGVVGILAFVASLIVFRPVDTPQ